MKPFRPCPKPPPRPKKAKKPISKRSKKKLDEIQLSKEYYQKAIEANILKWEGPIVTGKQIGRAHV